MSDLELGYQPRTPFIPLHARDNRFGVLVCHRRAGKTVACIGELITRALYTKKKNAKFAYIGPFRAQAKEVAWSYIKDMTKGIIKGNPRESELRVRLHNDATITIYGADNPDSFRGMYFDGVVIDEFGDVRATLWNEVILPALLDRNGWALFMGTPKGKNHFYKMHLKAKDDPDWFHLELHADTSGLLTEESIRLAKENMTDEAFKQEMLCDFEAAIPGTYYAKIITQLENEGRIGKYEYNPTLPVYAAADLGFSDSTAWWFWQVDEKGPFCINYEEDSGRPLSYYFDMLEALPYPVEIVYLPHDAMAASLQTGRTTIEQFLMRKINVKIVPRQKIQHGIDAARLVLKSVRIDSTNCYGGIEALRSYRRRFNERTGAYDDKPLHDWASNGSDAFRYLSLVTQQDVVEEAHETEVKQDGYCLEDLWQERESQDWRTSIIRL